MYNRFTVKAKSNTCVLSGKMSHIKVRIMVKMHLIKLAYYGESMYNEPKRGDVYGF